ncbi:hypothetical protein D6833_05005 [Candidatus Parcubacteria bacterium]|nr:MAG: hypothetical protein D6833_05005 [Candidatus Parcubacteria bacterium]
MGEIIADGDHGYVAVVQSGEVIFFSEGDQANPFLEAAKAGANVLRRRIEALLNQKIRGPVRIRFQQ